MRVRCCHDERHAEADEPMAGEPLVTHTLGCLHSRPACLLLDMPQICSQWPLTRVSLEQAQRATMSQRWEILHSLRDRGVCKAD